MHLITLKNWSADDVRANLDLSLDIAARAAHYAQALRGRSLALLFQKTSTRTRCAGEVGMTQLGGHALYMDWRASNFGLADLGDEIRVLSSYVDAMVVRLLRHDDVLTCAAASQVPVMNGCCDRYHPMQALADLMTIRQVWGRVEGVRLTYVGVLNNVCNSLVAAALKTGMHVTAVTPETNPVAADEALYAEAEGAGLFRRGHDLRASLEESDVVYTDTWIDMEFFADPAYTAEKERRMQLFQPYQLNRALLDGLDLRIMHCLPAHHGYEIDGELLQDPRCIVFPQAENRLYTQKAVLLQSTGNLP